MQFNLGTIVSLKSNGLLPLATVNFLSLGGNENYTTPLMVIVEILLNVNSEIDEETGEVKSNSKGQNKYKCLYFSNKSMKFEENWFAEKEILEYGPVDLETNIEIDIIDENKKQEEKSESSENKELDEKKHKLQFGDVIRFKTVDEEAKKTKSFNDGENKKGSKPVISYIAPSLQVIGFANPERKEPLIDSYSGKTRRKVSSKLVKCKFFNSDSDKFSEQIVPIECLQYIDNSNLENLLDEISKITKQKSLTLINKADSKYFGKPNSVHVYSGRYQLSIYNELTKIQEFIWLDKIKDFHIVDFSGSQYYPGVNEGSEEVTSIIDLIDSIKEVIVGQHFKITYCNLKEQRVSRYITVKLISKELFDIESRPDSKYYFLKSYCHLREASRDFRSDRILSIRTINEEKLNEYLTEKAKK